MLQKRDFIKFVRIKQAVYLTCTPTYMKRKEIQKKISYVTS